MEIITIILALVFALTFILAVIEYAKLLTSVWEDRYGKGVKAVMERNGQLWLLDKNGWRPARPRIPTVPEYVPLDQKPPKEMKLLQWTPTRTRD